MIASFIGGVYTGGATRYYDDGVLVDPYDNFEEVNVISIDPYRGGVPDPAPLPKTPVTPPYTPPPAFVVPVLPEEGTMPLYPPPMNPWEPAPKIPEDEAPKPVPSPPGITPQPAVPVPVPPGLLPPGASPGGSWTPPKVGPWQPPGVMPPSLPSLPSLPGLPDLTKPFDMAGDFMTMIVVMSLVRE